MLRNSETDWGSVAKSLHWLVAVLILGMFVLGWVAVSYPMSPTKLKLFNWHKSTGLTILALVVFRLFWRLGNPTPVLPRDMSNRQKILAHGNHMLLYAVMLAMPLSGWVINSAANFPLKLFGLTQVPSIAPVDKSLQTVAETTHLTLFWLFAGLVLLHVAAALWHHTVRGDNVLTRMLPFVANRGPALSDRPRGMSRRE